MMSWGPEGDIQNNKEPCKTMSQSPPGAKIIIIRTERLWRTVDANSKFSDRHDNLKRVDQGAQSTSTNLPERIDHTANNTDSVTSLLLTGTRTELMPKHNKKDQKYSVEYYEVEKRCLYCDEMHKPPCSLLEPKFFVMDKIGCPNSKIMSLSTLPAQLYLSTSVKDRNYMGVFASRTIRKRTQFGPAIGVPLTFSDLNPQTDFTYIWFTTKFDEWKEMTYMDVEDESRSNWCRYIQPSLDLEKCNLISFSQEDHIYFITKEKIEAGDELIVFHEFIPFVTVNFNIVPDESGNYYCTRCKLEIKNELNFIKHIMIFHPRGICRLKSQCKLCGEIFISESELGTHAQHYHQGHGAYTCSDCGRPYTSRVRYNAHRKMAHGNKGTYVCNICKKIYDTRWKLESHTRKMHTGENYRCERCNKSFTCKPTLLRHRKIHENSYSLFCDKCGKRFRDGNNLKVHMLSHSGIKPFQCREQHCKSAFTTKQCLQVHYRHTHGYTDCNMPKIIRKVPFTIEAYQGEHSSDITVEEIDKHSAQ